uniref:Putative secreted protein n=1 Tax=Hemileia vastatrix TaxID=203904 RepID=T1UMZ2_9BASI|nr:putative secreted protein [Hemileia vastatrix]
MSNFYLSLTALLQVLVLSFWASSAAITIPGLNSVADFQIVLKSSTILNLRARQAPESYDSESSQPTDVSFIPCPDTATQGYVQNFAISPCDRVSDSSSCTFSYGK